MDYKKLQPVIKSAFATFVILRLIKVICENNYFGDKIYKHLYILTKVYK